MSIENAVYAMSNINALLSSTLGYVNARQNGVPTGNALSDMGYNIMNGALRNAASRDIQRWTGSYLGYAVNSAAGYGNPVANYQGTVGTMDALMLSSITSSLYGCGPYGHGYWNSGFFGRGCCHNGFMFGGPSMFGCRGFLC